jgi:hypothetical protein
MTWSRRFWVRPTWRERCINKIDVAGREFK